MGKRSRKVTGRRLTAVLIILPLFCALLCGLDPDKKVDSYLVDQWEMPRDIPSNMIRTIAQTPDGYLWFATNKGLVRFDGIEFKIISFVKNEAETVESRETTIPDTLFVDNDGKFWIGSSAGLTRYDYRTGRFKTFTAGQGITRDRIRHINEDMKGNLWITFYSSYVDRFSNGKFTHFNASHGLEGKKINTIVEDSSGNLLFGTSENGVFIYKDGKFFKYPVPGLENLRINTMYEDRKGHLWIGTDQGLFPLSDKNRENYTTGDGLSHNYITAILEDSERNLWIGTKKGLNRLKKKQDGTVVFESSLKPFTTFSLFEDKEGSLWVGTYDAGIKRLKDRKFTAYTPLEAFPEEVLFSLFRDRQGDIWVGTSGGRLFHCRGSKLIETVEPPELSGTGVLAIAEDGEGNLWLGTNGKGAFQIKKGVLNRFTTRDGLADNQVSSIFKDSRDNLWFSTFDGVSVRCYPDGAFLSFTSGDGLSGKRVHNVYEDNAHNIWIAADKGITLLRNMHQIGVKRSNKSFAGAPGCTYSAVFNNVHGGDTLFGGLYAVLALQMLPHAVEFFQKAPPWPPEAILKGVPVTCIYEDLFVKKNEGVVYWIATHGAGLKRLNLKDDEIISYTRANGMATDFIYQFFEDRQGRFWLMSNSGILRIEKSGLNSFAGGKTDNIHCTSFGRYDGMKSSEFHSEFSRNSALKTRNGELWFLTRKGISIVNPEKIRVNKIPPPVVIEGVFFNGQRIPGHRDAVARPFKGSGDISFHFTAPSFLSPEKIRFKYRLEGFDNQWVFLSAGKEREAHYKNLGPGTYTFTVTACNAEGVWSRTGDSLSFTLKPLFYQTFLFKIILLLLFAGLVVVSFYIYKKRFLLIPCKSLLKKQRFEKMALTWENGHAVHAVGVADPFAGKKKEETGAKKDKDEEQGKDKPPLELDFVRECTVKLEYQMEVERAYRAPDISLRSLADKISIQPHLLSRILNEHLRFKFPDYINSYRIEEAKKILDSSRGAGENVTSVAHDVGFNSMTTFYKAFKKHTGMTPKQYKKEVEKKK